MELSKHLLNYDWDTSETSGENAWMVRKLGKNIYYESLSNAMAKMLMYQIEKGLIKVEDIK